MMKKLVLLFLFIVNVLSYNFTTIDLPDDHMPYYFHNFPDIAKKCEENPACPFKKYLNIDKCWGYEYDCMENNQYSAPACPGDHKGWVQSKQAQQTTFYTQADFGYVREQRREMKLLCEPLFPDDSSLECSDHLRFCRGRNIMINFTRLINRDEPIRYKMDVLQEGDIGGYCDLRSQLLLERADHISPLQSWGPEMRYFKRLYRRPIVEGDCDIVIEKPTVIMKLDAAVNMYHHFCDFFNLYASLHVNATNWNDFSTDMHILIWETYSYGSAFKDTWEAFTRHPLWDLKNFRGDVVCFKNVMFPLLPRMIFGLYYNTPIIYGCENSGLFHAFSNHVLHRLKIPFHTRKNKKIRITWISRDTSKRRILNEDEIIMRLRENEDYHVSKVVYNRDMSFKKQLEITRNSDILIGIHGAGLTHLLFLPDWAAVFEAYNCEDPNCYMDLTRLRGLKYITWENVGKLTTFDDGSYTGGATAKFVNYKFEVDEFERLVEKAAKHVKNHPRFKKLLEKDLDECPHYESEPSTNGKYNEEPEIISRIGNSKRNSAEKSMEDNSKTAHITRQDRKSPTKDISNNYELSKEDKGKGKGSKLNDGTKIIGGSYDTSQNSKIINESQNNVKKTKGNEFTHGEGNRKDSSAKNAQDVSNQHTKLHEEL